MEDLQKQITALQEEAEINKAKIAALESHIVDKGNELVDAQDRIRELESSVSIGSLADQKTTTDQVILSYGKKKYLVTAPRFKYQGKVYNAAELNTNKDLAKAMIDLSVGFIQELK